MSWQKLLFSMIYLGADHRGFLLKGKISLWIQQWGFPLEDLGSRDLVEEDDYPDIASLVAEKVSDHEKESVGILVCGSGVGVDVVANKFPKVRSVLGFSAQQVKAARQEDDVNILCLPADFLSDKKAQKIVAMFLKEDFLEESKYKRRIEKILSLEKKLVAK
jgi:RpiB/LacA/LacB family sugar-phosphate isomerase